MSDNSPVGRAADRPLQAARKIWEAPQITDVSLEATAKTTSTTEYGTAKNGS